MPPLAPLKPSLAEVLAALSLYLSPSIASYCRRTTSPPWSVTERSAKRREKLLFQPGSEDFASSPASPISAAEVAEQALDAFDMTPAQLLQEAASRLLGTHRRGARDLPAWALGEGLRRLLDTLDPQRPSQPTAGPSRFSRDECEALATDLLARARIVPAPPPERPGEVMLSALPLVEQPLPAWVCASFWASYVAGRAAVNNVLGLPSRFVAVEGFGTFHVLDSHPQSSFSLDASTPPTDGPPLFIIHGMFTNGLSMALLAAALADGGRRRVIVPDLLGSDFGCSTLTPIGGGSNDNDNDPSSSDAKKQHLTIARHVASLAALLNALGLSTVDVLGHSFGGFLAQELDLLLPPWRVRRLVLLCPGGGNRYLAGQSLRTIMGADVRATMEIFEHSIHNESLRRAVAAVFRTLSRTPYQTTLLLDVFDAQKYFLKFHDLSSKPVLLLWGSKDSVLEPREAKVQWRHMRGHPSSRAFWVEGSSHALNVDALATVSSATASFLDASSRSSDAAAAAAATAGSVMAQRPEPLGWFAAAVCAVPSMHRPLRPMMAEGLGHRSREEVEKANPRLLASRL